MSLVHADPDLRVDMTIISADGAATRIRFGARATNEAIANTVLGSEWVTRSRWVGDELRIESRVNQSGRRMHFCDY